MDKSTGGKYINILLPIVTDTRIKTTFCVLKDDAVQRFSVALYCRLFYAFRRIWYVIFAFLLSC